MIIERQADAAVISLLMIHYCAFRHEPLILPPGLDIFAEGHFLSPPPAITPLWLFTLMLFAD
jgi:hypothetical protein